MDKTKNIVQGMFVKTLMLLDTVNLHRSVRGNYGETCNIDYRLLAEHYADIDKIAYVSSDKLAEPLRLYGYDVRVKLPRKIRGSVQKILSFHIEICVEAMVENTKIILASNDPDYKYLLTHLKRKGIKPTVLGINVPRSMSYCADIEEIPKEFIRHAVPRDPEIDSTE